MLSLLTKNLFKRFFTLLLFTSFCYLSILAQEVIVITENKIQIEIPSELSATLATNSGNTKNIIRSWYSSIGYLNAKIEEVSKNKFDLTRGCVFSVSDFNIENGSFSSRSKSDLGEYSKDMIEQEVEFILKQLEKEGFLFAKAVISSFGPDLESCEVSISLNIEQGNRFVSHGILFPGAKLNKPAFLQQVSGYRDSVTITTSLLEDLVLNLIQSELFEQVGNPEVYLEEAKPIIVIPVEERVLNQFNGLLGYVPDQNGNGQIVGDFELSLWNVLNQGNKIGLAYQRLRPETSRLNVGVSQDYLGSIPAGIAFNFDFYQNDTTYQTRSLSLNSYYSISRGLKLTGGISSSTSVSGNNISFNLEPDGKKRSAELGFQYTTLNNVDVPTKGVQFEISFGVSNKSVDIDSVRAFSQQYIHSKAAYYIPISNKSVLAFSANSFFLTANRFTENDLIRFGGANSFRGYTEEQFRASELVWGDFEYRFLANRYSYLFAFGAVGRYQRPQLITETDQTFKVTDTLYSTGFGISYKIRIGRLKFTYALSPDENIGNGKVHLGIKTKL